MKRISSNQQKKKSFGIQPGEMLLQFPGFYFYRLKNIRKCFFRNVIGRYSYSRIKCFT